MRTPRVSLTFLCVGIAVGILVIVGYGITHRRMQYSLPVSLGNYPTPTSSAQSHNAVAGDNEIAAILVAAKEYRGLTPSIARTKYRVFRQEKGEIPNADILLFKDRYGMEGRFEFIDRKPTYVILTETNSARKVFFFHEDGTLLQYWEDPDGIRVHFHTNGTPDMILHASGGNLYGPMRRFDEQGNLVESTNFAATQPIRIAK